MAIGIVKTKGVEVGNKNYLSKDGAKELDVGYTPTTDRSIATKKYVDVNSGKDYRRLYVFENASERDAYFAAHPEELVVNAVTAIKDPPTPVVKNLNFSKSLNSQYVSLLMP